MLILIAVELIFTGGGLIFSLRSWYFYHTNVQVRQRHARNQTESAMRYLNLLGNFRLLPWMHSDTLFPLTHRSC